MLDFRLKVFYTTAMHLSFTKAAAELYISQPAVTKNIKELEAHFGIRLFDRRAGKISLTKAGELLLASAEQIRSIYRQVEFDFGVLKNKLAGKLRLGASTTIGQYLLPSVLANFYKSYPDINLSLLNANTEKIEVALLRKQIDLGVVEGRKHHPQLKYIPFIKDEIVAIVHSKSELAKLDQISLSQLAELPVVCRERGSGSLEILEDALLKSDFDLAKLQVLMYLGSTESIKSFLGHYNCLGFASVAAVAKEVAQGELKIIDIESLEITRAFYFAHLQGSPGGLAESFIRFAQRPYNQK